MLFHRHSFGSVIYAVGLTGLLWMGAAVLFARIIRYEGVIPIQVGGSERLVLAPAGTGGMFASHRNMPLEVLPLLQPRVAATVLDTNRLWDARDLGFPLRVREAEILRRFPDRHLLEISRGQHRTRALIFPDARVALDDFAVTVRHVGPWVGLIRMPGGQPASAWSVRESSDKPWKQGLFVRADAPSRAGDVILMFLPAADASAAQALLPETLPPDHRARWGVRQKGRTQWIETLQPGSGLTMPDGQEVTLVKEISGNPPELIFGVQSPRLPQKTETQTAPQYRVSLNGDPVDIGAETKLIAEAPAAAAESVWAASWEDNEVLAAIYREGRRIALEHLTPGKILTLSNGWTLRFDQALRESVQAGTFEEPVLAAAVTLPDGSEIVLREGMTVSAGPCHLRFIRETVPPEVCYTLVDASRKDAAPILLGPGNAVTLHGWKLSQYSDAPDPERVALIRARTVWWDHPAAWGLALLLAAAGLRAVLFLLPRRGPPQPFPEKPYDIGVNG